MGKIRTRVILTEEQKQKFIELFPTTSNRELAEMFGLTYEAVCGRGAQYGLNKDAEFAKGLRQANMKKAYKVSAYNRKGKVPDCAWKALEIARGKLSVLRNDKEWKQMVSERQREAMNDLIKAERRRIMFGLPQKTKRRVVKASWKVLRARRNLRNAGYSIDRGSYDIYINENTVRSESLEKRCLELKFKIHEYAER